MNIFRFMLNTFRMWKMWKQIYMWEGKSELKIIYTSCWKCTKYNLFFIFQLMWKFGFRTKSLYMIQTYNIRLYIAVYSHIQLYPGCPIHQYTDNLVEKIFVWNGFGWYEGNIDICIHCMIHIQISLYSGMIKLVMDAIILFFH